MSLWKEKHTDAPSPPPWVLLEGVTALSLFMVFLGLGWIVLATFWPDYVHVASPDVEVAVLLALVTVALLLVSLIALLHTRS